MSTHFAVQVGQSAIDQLIGNTSAGSRVAFQSQEAITALPSIRVGIVRTQPSGLQYLGAEAWDVTLNVSLYVQSRGGEIAAGWDLERVIAALLNQHGDFNVGALHVEHTQSEPDTVDDDAPHVYIITSQYVVTVRIDGTDYTTILT